MSDSEINKFVDYLFDKDLKLDEQLVNKIKCKLKARASTLEYEAAMEYVSPLSREEMANLKGMVGDFYIEIPDDIDYIHHVYDALFKNTQYRVRTNKDYNVFVILDSTPFAADYAAIVGGIISKKANEIRNDRLKTIDDEFNVVSIKYYLNTEKLKRNISFIASYEQDLIKNVIE